MSNPSSECIACVQSIETNGTKCEEHIARPSANCPDLERIFAMSSSDMEKFFAQKEVQNALNMVRPRENVEMVSVGALRKSIPEHQTATVVQNLTAKVTRSTAPKEHKGANALRPKDAPATQGRANAGAAGQRGDLSSNSSSWSELVETKTLNVTDFHNIAYYFRKNILTTFSDDLIWCLLNHVLLPIWVVLMCAADLFSAWFRFVAWVHLAGAAIICGCAVLLMEALRYVYRRSNIEVLASRIVDMLIVTFFPAREGNESKKFLIAYNGKIYTETDQTTELNPQAIFVIESP